jgi:hypothetical protein
MHILTAGKQQIFVHCKKGSEQNRTLLNTLNNFATQGATEQFESLTALERHGSDERK